MRLFLRFVLAFTFVVIGTVLGLGWEVRTERRDSETRRFEAEVRSACDRVVAEIGRQGESDRKLITGVCQSGELVDRAVIWTAAGTLDDERRLSLSRLVPEEREAFDLDELLLATESGELLGQAPITLLGTPRAEVARALAGDTAHYSVRTAPRPALVSRCRKAAGGGRAVGLIGARLLEPVLERLGNTLDAKVSMGATVPGLPAVAQASCSLADASGTQLPMVVSKSTRTLVENLARIDQTVIDAGLVAVGSAFLVALLLAWNLGRPIAQLAAETRKVASGQARPLRVRGSGEMAELARSFDEMLESLEATRRRLSAANRVAAWREVARRVAHEVKNPLAPIRAAVETLRRLRARQDPEFDAYFDEATRTVLDEVHRISTIVTEFTRFARLPAPRPQELDLMEVARQTVKLHEVGTPARVLLVVERVPPTVLADRDQIVQVVTNLVQNALDAVRDQGDRGEVVVTLDAEGTRAARLTVSDNGPGIAPEIASRLFEPYATTKREGTGLGLAIAQRIALEHGGELATAPAPGGAGAAFRLVLPIEGPPATSATGDAPSSR